MVGEKFTQKHNISFKDADTAGKIFVSVTTVQISTTNREFFQEGYDENDMVTFLLNSDCHIQCQEIRAQ